MRTRSDGPRRDVGRSTRRERRGAWVKTTLGRLLLPRLAIRRLSGTIVLSRVVHGSTTWITERRSGWFLRSPRRFDRPTASSSVLQESDDGSSAPAERRSVGKERPSLLARN